MSLPKIVILGLVLAAIHSQIVSSSNVPILISSPSIATVLSPVGSTTIQETYHTANNPNFVGYNANWIFINGTASWPANAQASFQSLFYSDCPQTVAVLTITADDKFVAYLNNVVVGTGSSWQQTYSFKLNLKCGINNLTVVVTNIYPNTPAGTVFVIYQNQTKCYDCPNANYDRKKCQCVCKSVSLCPKGQIWWDYPRCRCSCPKAQLCSPAQFWDDVNCICSCPFWCPKGYIQDQDTCKCKCLNCT